MKNAYWQSIDRWHRAKTRQHRKRLEFFVPNNMTPKQRIDAGVHIW